MRILLIIFSAILLFGYSQPIENTRSAVDTTKKARENVKDTIGPDTEGLVCILGCGIDANINHKIWTDYLTKNLVLDDSSKDTIPPGMYTVFVQFMIDEKGKISNVSVVKDPGFGLGKKVKKAVADYKGRWEPAQANGRPVKSYRKQPITFVVEEEEDKRNECKDELPAELIL